MGEAGALPCDACLGVRGFLTCEAVLRPKVVFRTIGRAHPTGTEDRPRGRREVSAVRAPPWGLAVGEAGAVRCGACSGIRAFLTSEPVLRPKIVFRTTGRVRPKRTEGRSRGKGGLGRKGPPLGSGRGGGWGPSMWRLLWASWVLDMRSSPSPEGHVPYSRPGSSDGDRRPAPGEEGGLGRKGPPLGPGRGGGWGPSM